MSGGFFLHTWKCLKKGVETGGDSIMMLHAVCMGTSVGLCGELQGRQNLDWIGLDWRVQDRFT